jgi:sulfate adenylyltransferase subunit 1
MDLVGYDEHKFYRIAADYKKLAEKLGVPEVTFIPISALAGDNVVTPSENMPWYEGKTLLDHLETIDAGQSIAETGARFQVQYVIRPRTEELHDYRGYAGSLVSGVLRRGDRVRILPSGIESVIQAIEVHQTAVEEAFAPQPVVIHLQDDIDISRGDSIVRLEEEQPSVGQDIELDVCWMSDRPLQAGDKYLVRHGASSTKAFVKEILHRTDVHSFEQQETSTLQLNDIARIRLRTARPLVYDSYKQNRSSGGIILVNQNTFDTVAAGMLLKPETEAQLNTEFAI